MSYISVEIRAYDEARKVVTVAFSEKWPVKLSSAVIAELTLEDCDTIGRDGELAEAGLTDDEACVLKMLFEDEGTIEDFLANPARLIGRASELDELASLPRPGISSSTVLSLKHMDSCFARSGKNARGSVYRPGIASWSHGGSFSRGANDAENMVYHGRKPRPWRDYR